MRTEAKDGSVATVSYENRRSGLPDGPTLNILVTGFGPFRDHVVNASWESVRLLPNEDIRPPPNVRPGTKINLIIHQIPVIYRYVADHMEQLWEKYQPHLVIHVGVSGIATAITLEQFAHNSGYCSPDILECTPDGSVCVGGGCDIIESGFDMKLVTTTLNTTAETNGVVAEFSYDPGRYLCDFTYYKSLSIDKDRTAFIHVPPLGKPWSADKMARAIKICITEFIRQLQEKNLLDTSFRRATEFHDRHINRRHEP
ncbi:unnamed protein product [Allacma fusca]|uniref:Pyroglutamyl-peptidase I n=1 Tax=Allacma fusca TaxID=39272 RepID=A0A8J2PMS3_9HEXA|nr:unnamed protein product [Allacma fusca]